MYYSVASVQLFIPHITSPWQPLYRISSKGEVPVKLRLYGFFEAGMSRIHCILFSMRLKKWGFAQDSMHSTMFSMAFESLNGYAGKKIRLL